MISILLWKVFLRRKFYTNKKAAGATLDASTQLWMFFTDGEYHYFRFRVSCSVRFPAILGLLLPIRPRRSAF